MPDVPYDYDVIIVGGGLAGLTVACALADMKISILLIEKRKYPFHKVCGEYISNEVLNFLRSLGFDPFSFGASAISRLRVSTPSGKNVFAPLGLGGFGLSRHVMDKTLCELARSKGATVWEETKVIDIQFTDDGFHVSIKDKGTLSAKLVVGAYGKRDMLDKKLDREFISRHTGYMGVKYHIATDYPIDEIGLDNFEGGYCGTVKIEEDKYNICYLYKRSDKLSFKSTHELEERVLYKNPMLRNIFTNARFVTEKPEVINEICFDRKQPVEQHIIMCGDTAGLITPLCGNGMSMAIAAGKLLTDLVQRTGILNKKKIALQDRLLFEQKYTKQWQDQFGSRLFWGRALQSVFGLPLITDASIRCINAVPPLRHWLINATHGQPV